MVMARNQRIESWIGALSLETTSLRTENTKLEQQLKQANKLLKRITGMCGNPSASDGCRSILSVTNEYLAKYKVKE